MRKKTILLRARDIEKDRASIEQAGQILREGGLVVFPTETVYGIGANALNAEAVSAIFEAKGRPQDNPLIVHVTDLEGVAALVPEISAQARRLAEVFWPGPLTLVLPRGGAVPALVSAGLDTVAIRIPSHPIARAVLHAAGVPIAAPSANRSGRPSPTDARHCALDLEGRVDLILDGGVCEVGVESTVLSLTGERPRLLRPGGVTVSQLEEVIGPIEVDPAILMPLGEDVRPSSPGMKYRHYAPKAEITLVEGDREQFASFCRERGEAGAFALCFDSDIAQLPIPAVGYGEEGDAEAQAHRLFSALRELDERGAKNVYARPPAADGVGLAVYNRLLRAASFRQISAADRSSAPQPSNEEKSMPHCIIIGLTGQTGAGKTLVSGLLSERGACVIDCDRMARQVVDRGTECLRELAGTFGADMLNPDGTLNRRKLGDLVFADAEARTRLNGVIFPHIHRAMDREIERLKRQGADAIFLDAPTLFESGADARCDKIVSVIAPAPLRKKRIMDRDGLTEEQADNRISAQHGDEFFIARSDFVLRNDAESDVLREAVDGILSALGLGESSLYEGSRC